MNHKPNGWLAQWARAHGIDGEERPGLAKCESGRFRVKERHEGEFREPELAQVGEK
jgi:hypothetical protein